MKMRILSTTILATFLCIPAIADDSVLNQQSGMAQMLLDFDTDGDGFISRDEVLAGKTAEFNGADTDGNGYLSWNELQVLINSKHATRNSTLFSVMDTDASGGVNIGEFSSAFADKSTEQASTVFSLVSGDDESISIEELTAIHEQGIGKQMWKFAKQDSDSDGQLSVDEYTEMPSRGRSNDRSDNRRGQGHRRSHR